MVKKLLKQEYLYYARSLLLVEIILIGIACLNRFVQFFEMDHWSYDILFGSSTFMLVFGCIACGIIASILVIVRFYKNLFTSEGYLTFTLPVSESQHILVKLLSGVLAIVSTILTIGIVILIAMSGDLLTEIYKAIQYLIAQIESYKLLHFWGYIIEIVILFIIGLTSSILFYYICIAIGQLSKKNRIFLAIAVYFGFNALFEILSTILLTVLSIFGESISNFILNFIETYTYASIHTILIGANILNIVIGIVFFFITQTIIRKKLNLE